MEEILAIIVVILVPTFYNVLVWIFPDKYLGMIKRQLPKNYAEHPVWGIYWRLWDHKYYIWFHRLVLGIGEIVLVYFVLRLFLD